MSTLKAKVVNGRLILDEPSDLPEGTVVELVVARKGVALDVEQRSTLLAALDGEWQGLSGGAAQVEYEEILEEIKKRKKSPK